MNYYENTFILDAQLPDEVIHGKVSEIQKVVSANAGEVLHVEEWGNRRLAYEISKKTQGYYVFMQLSAPPEGIRELERALGLDESVLRYLTILIEKEALKENPTDQPEQKG